MGLLECKRKNVLHEMQILPIFFIPKKVLFNKINMQFYLYRRKLFKEEKFY